MIWPRIGSLVKLKAEGLGTVSAKVIRYENGNPWTRGGEQNWDWGSVILIFTDASYNGATGHRRLYKHTFEACLDV